MPRKKKSPEIITDDYAEMLALREQLLAKEAKVADNRKAALSLFAEFVIDRNPEWARNAVDDQAPPELKERLASYGWKYIIEPKIAASKKVKGQPQQPPERPVDG